jgi:transitional endoplasmic reticulum ATPase
MSRIEGTSQDSFVGRVRDVDEEGERVYVRFRNGGTLTFSVSEVSEFSEGDLVLVDIDNLSIEPAPERTWDYESWVGVVRHISTSRTIVARGSLLDSVPTNEKEYAVGNTVEVNEGAGVVEVLAPKPLDSIDDPSDANTSADRFKVRTGADADSNETYEDFGGFDDLVAQVKGVVSDSLTNRQALAELGATPTKGLLFIGPRGTGKTKLARIVANMTNVGLWVVNGPAIVGKYAGESEKTLRKIFDAAAAEESNGAIIFFDEIDSIAGRRETLSHDFSRSVVDQLLTLMDGFQTNSNTLVIAATNQPHTLDPAVKRPGRFDEPVHFRNPGQSDREAVLRTVSRKQPSSGDLPHAEIARETEGRSPAELERIWNVAARTAIRDERTEVNVEDYLIGYEQVAEQKRQMEGNPGVSA